MEIIVDINNECNNKCIFCSKNYVSNFDWKKGDIDIDKLKEKVILNKDKKGDIYIGGVEPFNYNNLLDLVLFIKKSCSGKKIIIKTSGVIDNVEKINKEIFKFIDIIQIPCNSLKEDNFNYIYGNNKAFIQYKKFLTFLEENNISEKLFFHTVILKNNYLDIPEILLFLHSKFFIRKLSLIYPIKPYNEIKGYYGITVPRKEIKGLYKEFIDKGVFELINFDKTIKYYEKNNF